MTDDPPQKDHIQVAVRNGVGYARVLGRGSFKVSASVKEYGNALLNSGVKRLVIDLRDCVGMDSTFMGVTAGLCNRFHKEGNATVEMVNCSDKVKRLMSTLGLDRLVDVVSGDSPDDSIPEKGELEDLAAKPESPLESAENMLEAHENLVKVHSDNEMRFQDVLDYLREDIQRQRRS